MLWLPLSCLGLDDEREVNVASLSHTEELRETGEGEILGVFLRVIQVNRVLREDLLEPLNDSTSQSVHCTSTFHISLS